MSHEGFPKLGPEYTGFLHRHHPRPGFPEMKNHVVVDLEDWLIARQSKGSAEQQTDNTQSKQALREIAASINAEAGFSKNENYRVPAGVLERWAQQLLAL